MIDIHTFLSQNVFFTSRELATYTNRPLETATRQLTRLMKKGVLVRITRGIWGQPNHPFYSLYGAVPYLLGNNHGYISFLTALHRAGIISQVPTSIQVATTGHSRRLKSAIGVFEFIQIQPNMFKSGIEYAKGKLTYQIATAEKALADTLYVSSRKGKRFDRLPELELENFDERIFNRLVKQQVKFQAIQEFIQKKWKTLKGLYWTS